MIGRGDRGFHRALLIESEIRQRVEGAEAVQQRPQRGGGAPVGRRVVQRRLIGNMEPHLPFQPRSRNRAVNSGSSACRKR